MFLFIGIFLIGIFNGFINVTVGGAGLINTPLLLALGLGPYSAIATTKFITFGSGFAGSSRYHRGKIFQNKKLVLFILVLSLIGGVIGAQLTFLINELVLEWTIVGIALLILFLTIFKKPKKETVEVVHHSKVQYGIALVAIFFTSIYGGSIGMGAGIVVIAILVHYMKYTYIQSSALMTIFTLALTFGSAVTFMLKGAVNYEFGIPLFIGSAIGGWIGAHIAIKKGNKLIEILTVIIALVLIGKVLMDLL
jgi:uncharacterized membrane protein YfcA